MKYEYWEGSSGQALAKKEVEKALKNNKQEQRIYYRRREIFQSQEYGVLVSSGTIEPLKNSVNRLHEWKLDFKNRTARMFFVTFENCAYFLHFIIKKSTKGKSTDPGAIELAESRASQCLKILK